MIFEKEGHTLTLPEFEKLTGVKWEPQLDFDDSVLSHITKEALKLHKKGEMTLEQLWLGRYFQKEISSSYVPDIAIRWIDPTLGWGVFAMRDFKKMQFIAEYTGKLRKRRREDVKNAYCFEYVVAQGFRSPYTIDALDQGAVARYINHSETPNLNSSLATFDNISHVVLYAKEPIAKGAQLCYDYGPDYWSKRTAPIPL
jgi:uncharacterized protein